MLSKLILDLDCQYGDRQGTIKYESYGNNLIQDELGYKFQHYNKEIYYNVEIEEVDYCQGSSIKYSSFIIYREQEQYYYTYNEKVTGSPYLDSHQTLHNGSTTADSFDKIVNIARKNCYGFYGCCDFDLFTYFYNFFCTCKNFNRLYMNNQKTIFKNQKATNLYLDYLPFDFDTSYYIWIRDTLGNIINHGNKLIAIYPKLQPKFKKVKLGLRKIKKQHHLQRLNKDVLKLILFYL